MSAKPISFRIWSISPTREFGRIDILVNNAATNIAQGPCLEMDEGQFDKMVEINLKSTFRLMKLVAPGMCERGSGSIINIASIAGLRPAVPQPALQHDQGRADHDDAILRASSLGPRACA